MRFSSHIRSVLPSRTPPLHCLRIQNRHITILNGIKSYNLSSIPWPLISKEQHSRQRPSGQAEGLDVSVLPIGSVAGLPVALHPYG